MKNKLTDLNNHLFAQLERLGDESLTLEQLQVECERAKAIERISDQILEQKRIELDAIKTFVEYGGQADQDKFNTIIDIKKDDACKSLPLLKFQKQ